MDAQILGVLRLLGAVPLTNMVFHERNAVYLAHHHLFYIGLLHPRGPALEIV